MRTLTFLLLTFSLHVSSQEMIPEDVHPEDWRDLTFYTSMYLSDYNGEKTVNIFFDFWFKKCEEASKFMIELKAFGGEIWKNNIEEIDPFRCQVIRRIRMDNDIDLVAYEQFKMFKLSESFDTTADFFMPGP